MLTVESQNDNNDPLHIFTDSEYARGCLIKGWRPKRNKALVESLKSMLEEMRERREVEIIWVKGHSKIVHNDTADELANQGTKASEKATEPNGCVKNAEVNRVFYYENA